MLMRQGWQNRPERRVRGVSHSKMFADTHEGVVDAPVLWVCLHNPDGGMYQRHLSRTLQHRTVVHRLGSPVCIAMIFGIRFLGHSSFRTRAGTGPV